MKILSSTAFLEEKVSNQNFERLKCLAEYFQSLLVGENWHADRKPCFRQENCSQFLTKLGDLCVVYLLLFSAVEDTGFLEVLRIEALDFLLPRNITVPRYKLSPMLQHYCLFFTNCDKKHLFKVIDFTA